jgi:hypothetical protein
VFGHLRKFSSCSSFELLKRRTEAADNQDDMTDGDGHG